MKSAEMSQANVYVETSGLLLRNSRIMLVQLYQVTRDLQRCWIVSIINGAVNLYHEFYC